MPMSKPLTEIMIYTIYLFYFCDLAFTVVQKMDLQHLISVDI